MDDSLRERSVSAAAAVRVQARAAGTNQPAWLSANLAGTGPPARPPLWLHAGAPAAWLLLRAARRASHVCRLLYRARCTLSAASLQGSYGCATALCSHRRATRRVKSRDSRSARLAAARHAERSTVATVGQRRQRAADNVRRTPCRIRRVTFRRLHAALLQRWDNTAANMQRATGDMATTGNGQTTAVPSLNVTPPALHAARNASWGRSPPTRNGYGRACAWVSKGLYRA